MKKLFQKDDLVQVGQTIAIIETEASSANTAVKEVKTEPVVVAEIEKTIEQVKETITPTDFSGSENSIHPW